MTLSSPFPVPVKSILSLAMAQVQSIDFLEPTSINN